MDLFDDSKTSEFLMIPGSLKEKIDKENYEYTTFCSFVKDSDDVDLDAVVVANKKFFSNNALSRLRERVFNRPKKLRKERSLRNRVEKYEKDLEEKGKNKSEIYRRIRRNRVARLIRISYRRVYRRTSMLTGLCTSFW